MITPRLTMAKHSMRCRLSGFAPLKRSKNRIDGVTST